MDRSLAVCPYCNGRNVSRWHDESVERVTGPLHVLQCADCEGDREHFGYFDGDAMSDDERTIDVVKAELAEAIRQVKEFQIAALYLEDELWDLENPADDETQAIEEGIDTQ